jgi:hypothetical protein
MNIKKVDDAVNLLIKIVIGFMILIVLLQLGELAYRWLEKVF